MKWYWVHNQSQPKEPRQKSMMVSHAVPEVLREAILKNLNSRFDGTIIKPMKEVWIDLGGIMMQDQQEYVVNLDGLLIHIPASHVSSIVEQIKKYSVRNEIGRKYYKLHFWLRCICMTPSQYKKFLSALERILPQCLAIEAAENEEFNRRIVDRHPHILVKPRPVKMKIGKG